MNDSSGDPNRFIQHHYDDAKHQFDTGKLGMWLFLAQEVLFFSGLFVAYIVYRSTHPELFLYANHYLNTTLGAINTGVLLVSSLTAAWAVRAAQLGKKRQLVVLLVLTIACAFGFLAIKAVEYSHKIHEGLLFGNRFDPCITPSGRHLITKSNHCPGSKSTIVYDKRQKKAASGCIEGDLDMDPAAEGLQADCSVTERVVTFRKVDNAWTKFEKATRKIAACAEAPGASSSASDASPCWEVVDARSACHTTERDTAKAVLVIYPDHAVRGPTVQIDASCRNAPERKAEGDPFASPAPTKLGVHPPVAQSHDQLVQHLRQADPPANTGMFFSIYFAMTGLHGLHVLVGIGIFIWLAIRAAKGHFGPNYFGPIDNAALYWHLVDLIWIFLFPLFYLIH